MANQYKVLDSQNILDAAIQLGGGVDCILDLLTANGLDFSAVLASKQMLYLPATTNADVQAYLYSEGINVATGNISSGLGEFSLAFTSAFD